MGTLFVVNRSAALASCLARAGADDTVLLIEDGVYGAVHAPQTPAALAALQADVIARGLVERVPSTVRVIDDDGFVALAAEHQPVVTWR